MTKRLNQRRAMMKFLWAGIVAALVLSNWVDGLAAFGHNETELPVLETEKDSKAANNISMVGLSLIPGACSKGAVCLDGTLPAYHLHRGYGSGRNSWLIRIQGGAWCNNISSCNNRKYTAFGSSAHMEKEIAFTGILSSEAEDNPEFFNWNRVMLRYCDGASFSGDSENEEPSLQFRGQRIWLSAMEDFMSKGMHYANQALLAGCSSGGLSAILHCDEFRGLFPRTTKVKCLSDAGLFLDAVDISGVRTLRDYFSGVVGLQGVKENLPQFCTGHLDPTSCFFPENLIANITTPLFILNSAYDSWQIGFSLAPPSADPRGEWNNCRLQLGSCSPSQMQILRGFRNQMLNAVKQFSMSEQNGMIINSCYAHCQTVQGSWLGHNSPVVGNKTIAQAVGDWYFDRAEVKVVDETCRHLPLKNGA